MPFNYNKVLIIGATSGIGKALATKVVEANIPLVISGRREENLQEFVREHGSDKVKAKAFDVTKIDQVRYTWSLSQPNSETDGHDRSLNLPQKFSKKTPTSTASSSTDRKSVV